eukprot:COSAG05_NODE_7661_length_782_cov_5.102489_1_plen_29_part_10
MQNQQGIPGQQPANGLDDGPRERRGTFLV